VAPTGRATKAADQTGQLVVLEVDPSQAVGTDEHSHREKQDEGGQPKAVGEERGYDAGQPSADRAAGASDASRPFATIDGAAFALPSAAPLLQRGAAAPDRQLHGKVAVLAATAALAALALCVSVRRRRQRVNGDERQARVAIRGPPVLQHP
jgi:hypothetical protein